jgi:valyl-tRNA synthetase
VGRIPVKSRSDGTTDLRTFYPGSVTETGLDILFFWVALMVMMSTQPDGGVPFQKVYSEMLYQNSDL